MASNDPSDSGRKQGQVFTAVQAPMACGLRMVSPSSGGARAPPRPTQCSGQRQPPAPSQGGAVPIPAPVACGLVAPPSPAPSGAPQTLAVMPEAMLRRPPMQVFACAQRAVPSPSSEIIAKSLGKSPRDRPSRPKLRCKIRRPSPRTSGVERPKKVKEVVYPKEDTEVLRKSLESPKVLSFSVDLLTASETLLSSIAEFGGMADLHSDDALERALVRYELFLALYCSVAEEEGEEAAKRLAPPPDVAHCWRAHLIRPVTYRQDCQDLFGRQISPSVLFSDAFASDGDEEERNARRAAAVAQTKEKWDTMVAREDLPPLSYTPSGDLIEDLPCAEVSIGLIHLTEDLSWWTKFQDFFGEEYSRDRKLFLEKRQESYKDFLLLGAARTLAKIEDPKEPVNMQGPPVDVDLFWHCHMMFPEAYDSDLHSQLGCVFYHQPAADPESQLADCS